MSFIIIGSVRSLTNYTIGL